MPVTRRAPITEMVCSQMRRSGLGAPRCTRKWPQYRQIRTMQEMHDPVVTEIVQCDGYYTRYVERDGMAVLVCSQCGTSIEDGFAENEAVRSSYDEDGNPLHEFTLLGMKRLNPVSTNPARTPVRVTVSKTYAATMAEILSRADLHHVIETPELRVGWAFTNTVVRHALEHPLEHHIGYVQIDEMMDYAVKQIADRLPAGLIVDRDDRVWSEDFVNDLLFVWWRIRGEVAEDIVLAAAAEAESTRGQQILRDIGEVIRHAQVNLGSLESMGPAEYIRRLCDRVERLAALEHEYAAVNNRCSGLAAEVIELKKQLDKATPKLLDSRPGDEGERRRTRESL